MVAANVHHRRQKFACRQAPTRGGDRPQPPNVFAPVGASLLANGGGKRASPQAKICLQASSHKGRGPSSTSKCLCPCRSQPAGESCRSTLTPNHHQLNNLLHRALKLMGFSATVVQVQTKSASGAFSLLLPPKPRMPIATRHGGSVPKAFRPSPQAAMPPARTQ